MLIHFFLALNIFLNHHLQSPKRLLCRSATLILGRGRSFEVLPSCDKACATMRRSTLRTLHIISPLTLDITCPQEVLMMMTLRCSHENFLHRPFTYRHPESSDAPIRWLSSIQPFWSGNEEAENKVKNTKTSLAGRDYSVCDAASYFLLQIRSSNKNRRGTCVVTLW